MGSRNQLLEKNEELKEEDYSLQDRVYECGYTLNGEPSYKHYFKALEEAKGTKVEDQERVEEEQRELQFRELREKTFESVENAFVSRNNPSSQIPSSQILLNPS